MKRYSAGIIDKDGNKDFYYDTTFSSEEEAEEWGINHDCTHIFDAVIGRYKKIGGRYWKVYDL